MQLRWCDHWTTGEVKRHRLRAQSADRAVPLAALKLGVAGKSLGVGVSGPQRGCRALVQWF